MTKYNLFYGHEKGNHLYIFDLKRLPTNNAAMEYEFSYDPHIRDFFYKKKGTKTFQKKEYINKLPDYSLVHYIKFLYLNKPKVQVYLNNEPVEFENY